MGGEGIFLQPAADFETVHAGHHHIEQDDVGRPLRDLLQGLFAVLGFDDFIAVRPQRVSQQHAVGFLIIHHQHESVMARDMGGGGGWFAVQGFSLHIRRWRAVRLGASRKHR